MGSGKEFYDFELLRSGRAHFSPPPEAGDERKREEREGGIKIQSGLDVFVGAVPSTSSPLSSFPLVACGTGIYAQFTGNIALVLPSKCECQWSLTFSTMSVIFGALDEKG